MHQLIESRKIIIAATGKVKGLIRYSGNSKLQYCTGVDKRANRPVLWVVTSGVRAAWIFIQLALFNLGAGLQYLRKFQCYLQPLPFRRRVEPYFRSQDTFLVGRQEIF